MADTVWVLSANAPDNQSVAGVYVSPEAAKAANPEGEWHQDGPDWIVTRPVGDSLYGGVLTEWEVQP